MLLPSEITEDVLAGPEVLAGSLADVRGGWVIPGDAWLSGPEWSGALPALDDGGLSEPAGLVEALAGGAEPAGKLPCAVFVLAGADCLPAVVFGGELLLFGPAGEVFSEPGVDCSGEVFSLLDTDCFPVVAPGKELLPFGPAGGGLPELGVECPDAVFPFVDTGWFPVVVSLPGLLSFGLTGEGLPELVDLVECLAGKAELMTELLGAVFVSIDTGCCSLVVSR